MLRGSVALERAFAGSYVGAVKCEAWIAGRRVASDLPLVAASVSGDRDNFVRRSTSMTFVEDRGAAGESLAATLARPGCEVVVSRGAYLGSRPEFLPVHWGVAENPKWDWRTRGVTLTSPDLAMRVSLDRFVRPRRSTRGMTVPQQITALVRETLPRVRVIDESGSSVAVPNVVWERDRNVAVTELAASIGCETYFRPDGTWVIRRIPTLVGVAALRIREGADLTEAGVETDWSGVRNHLVVSSERSDGAALRGESADLDPNSPTYVAGPLRRRTGFYSSSLFTTSAQCTQAALALRARMQGAQVSVDYTATVHPGVEAGDRHDVSVDGSTHRIVLDAFSFDVFGGTMTGSGRSARALPEGVS